MSKEIPKPVLELLVRISAKLDGIFEKMDGVELRLRAIEEHLEGLTALHGGPGSETVSIKQRLERIEQHLKLPANPDAPKPPKPGLH